MDNNNIWAKHFVDMVNGKVPYNKRIYNFTNQSGNGDIQMISPNQAIVEQAKMDIKRKLKSVPLYKHKKIKLTGQCGNGNRKKRTVKKKLKKRRAKKKTPKRPKKKKKSYKKNRKKTKKY